MVEYDLKRGYKAGGSVDAGAVARALMDLRQVGALTPQRVVAAAADAKSPLHGYFDWDDTVAAKRWRLEQARELICNVRIVVETEEPQRLFIHISTPEEGPQYEAKAKVLSDYEKKESACLAALDRCLASLKLYEEVSGVYGVIAAVQRVIKDMRGDSDVG